MNSQYTIVQVEGWWHVIAPDGEVVFDKATSKEHAEKMLRWLLDQKKSKVDEESEDMGYTPETEGKGK